MYGDLTVITGPMFSGKSTELIKRILWSKHAEKNVLVIKPSFDDRYSSTKIVSHDGLSSYAIAINSWRYVESLAEDADIVFIDEVQFFTQPNFDSSIIDRIYDLLKAGKNVVVNGLDLDWQGQPFEITATLLAMADTPIKLKSNCTVCGHGATKTFKKVPNSNQLELGSTDLYEARCNTHFLP